MLRCGSRAVALLENRIGSLDGYTNRLKRQRSAELSVGSRDTSCVLFCSLGWCQAVNPRTRRSGCWRIPVAPIRSRRYRCGDPVVDHVRGNRPCRTSRFPGALGRRRGRYRLGDPHQSCGKPVDSTAQSPRAASVMSRLATDRVNPRGGGLVIGEFEAVLVETRGWASDRVGAHASVHMSSVARLRDAGKRPSKVVRGVPITRVMSTRFQRCP